MEENFSPVVQTRANYYTPGSPVQFVRVELLRGDTSGDNAVCLTFKNISQAAIDSLEIHFKCKGQDGAVMCEDDFTYESLAARPGELFGMDDAVFITQKPISSVDVVLKKAVGADGDVDLRKARRVRLPAPVALAPQARAELQQSMGRKGLRYQPQILDAGWYCACGAFHPNEEDTVYCSECGSDRILLQNALNHILQPQGPAAAAEAQPVRLEEPTRVRDNAPPTPVGEPAQPAAAGGTRSFEPAGAAKQPAAKPAAALAEQATQPDDDPRDAVAEGILRWVPPITALICAGIALSGFVYCQFFV